MSGYADSGLRATVQSQKAVAIMVKCSVVVASADAISFGYPRPIDDDVCTLKVKR